MSKLLSLLIVLLFTFDITLVAARPKVLKYRPAATPVDISGLNTNAKRFAAGLPPLPPTVKKIKPTRVDTARRDTTSQCAKLGMIQVIDANTNAVTGYLSQDLTANQHYGLATLSDAATFSSTVSTSGETQDINIVQSGVTGNNPNLAGLIMQNAALANGDGDDKAAILGRSQPTGAGQPPQANKNPTFNNRDSETAIWTYNRADNSLTATWTNYATQSPATTVAYFSYLSNGDKFYLTNSRTPPQNGVAVLFKFISAVGDQCGP